MCMRRHVMLGDRSKCPPPALFGEKRNVSFRRNISPYSPIGQADLGSRDGALPFGRNSLRLHALFLLPLIRVVSALIFYRCLMDS